MISADNSTEWVEVGDIARHQFNDQCQYMSRYLTGIGGQPRLGDDLRWHGGDPDTLFRQLGPGGDYHSLRIHRDDVDTWVQRVNDHRRATGQIA
jgi:hypothetical protein